jgi:asparaginyl-tRNA synthetase
VGQSVTVCGWVKTRREQGNKIQRLYFIELTDGSMMNGLQVGSCSVFLQPTLFPQLVLNSDHLSSDVLDKVLAECSTGASLKAVGEVVKSPAKGQVVEVRCGII